MNDPHSGRLGHAVLLALFLLSPPATLAAPGDLYAPYGRAGLAVEPAPVATQPAYAGFLGSDPGPATVVAPDGSVLLARTDGGRCMLERLGVDGLGGLAPLGSPVACSDRLRPEVTVGADGEIVFVYAPDPASIAIQRRRADGSLDARFGNGGTAVVRPAEGAVGRGFAMLLPDGDVMAAVNGSSTSPQSDYSTLLLLRLRADGTPAAWGTGGVVRVASFEWGPLGADGVGVVATASGVTLYGAGTTTLYGGTRYGFFSQRFGADGYFYPYFAPESSVDASGLVLGEFNDGSLAALFATSDAWNYDGPAARFQALPFAAMTSLQRPAALAASGSRLTPMRFRPLAGGGLLLAALHEVPVAGAMHGNVVLLRYRQDGQADTAFGREGVATLDFGLGGPPYALPRTLSAPTPIGGDRVMIAAWAAGRLGVASLQTRPLGSSAGRVGWQARDGRFVTATDAAEATLRFRVARVGGRQGAISVDYRSRAPAELAGRFTPLSGRIDWPDGDDAPREVALVLRTPPVEGASGTIDLELGAVAGTTLIGSAVQQVAIGDYGGGTLAFERERASVERGATTLRLGVTRSGGTRGAITATVRVPLGGGAGERTVSWAEGESGTRQVDVPVDADWDHFVVELQGPARTQLGEPARVAVDVTEPARAPAASAPAPASVPTPTSSGSGGGALDRATLGLLLAALLATVLPRESAKAARLPCLSAARRRWFRRPR